MSFTILEFKTDPNNFDFIFLNIYDRHNSRDLKHVRSVFNEVHGYNNFLKEIPGTPYFIDSDDITDDTEFDWNISESSVIIMDKTSFTYERVYIKNLAQYLYDQDPELPEDVKFYFNAVLLPRSA